MCYLIAKDIDKRGCVALKTQHGNHLVEFKRKLISIVGVDKIQLVTISRPSAFGEYEPYNIVSDEESFEKAVTEMAK